MNDFHFLRPQFLYLLLPFFILLFFFIRAKRLSTIWNQVCALDLLPYVLAKKAKKHVIPYCLASIMGLFLIGALAGPSWQMVSQPLIKTQSGLVIALDLSPAMNAADIKPSRLQAAIYKLTDILNLRKEGQTALIAYSADPYVVTPLTDDAATIKALLPVLQTNIMPSIGHRTEKAIAKGVELLAQGGIANGSILLVTAELSNPELEKAIEIAVKHGVSVSVLGAGTEEGAPIPNEGGGLTKDKKGSVIVSMLSKDNLSKLAKSTHGTYVRISLDETDSAALVKGFSSSRQNPSQEQTEMRQNQWHDEGYWLVLLAIPFASLYFRKGILNAFFILPFFLMPYALHAFSWPDLWKTPDQQAEQFFHQQEYQKAKDLFQNSDWQGAASYQLGEYEAAADRFQSNQTAEGYYNHGTAKAKHGDLKEALASYEKALEIQPDHEDALYNKKVIEEHMKQQEENKDQKKDQQNSKDQNQKKDKEDKAENSEDKKQDKHKDDKQENSEDQNQEENKDDKQESSKDQKQDDNKDGKQEDSPEKNQDSNQQQDKKENSDSQDSQSREKSDKKNDAKEFDEKEKKELQDLLTDQINQKLRENEERPSEQEAALESESPENDPQQQMDERWLQKVADDPGGLLRRKFLQQYRQQRNE